MFRTIIIAFSTYSKIPMPSFEWKVEDMKYTMCAFPLVGFVLALIQYGAYTLLKHFGAGYVLTASIMTFLPLFITGGIHMDGYMDTWDALCSYGDKEKKLEILKDPHVGAFAVIHCVLYVMLTFAFWYELVSRMDTQESDIRSFYMVLSGYMLSRILSALYAVTYKKARQDGMLSDITRASDKRSRIILIILLIIYTIAISRLLGARSLLIFIPAAAISFYYRYISYSRFGGITGDLAGWFLQIMELAILFTSVFRYNYS